MREAPPSPAPGPIRDALADAAAARAERAGQTMMDGIDAFTARARGVILARLRGPKSRKGTQYWSDRVKSAADPYSGGGHGGPLHLEGHDGPTTAVEVKALDAEYVAPDSLTGEIIEAMRPLALRVANDAATDAATRVRKRPAAGKDPATEAMFTVDQKLLGDLVDEALEDLLGGAERYTAEVRKALLTGDADGVPLEELLDNVGEALDKGGNWLRLSGRTIGTALAGKAAIQQARALGVTHTQWVSRRDERVRPTHRVADGQVREVGDAFAVGHAKLDYPGDPSGLPATAGEVMGCRCGLLFADVDDAFLNSLDEIMSSARESADLDDGAPAGVAEAVAAAAATAVFVPGPDVPGVPNIASVIALDAAVVGWRVLDVAIDAIPGQQITLPAGTTFGMASPRQLAPTTLAVLMPEGTTAGIAGGTITLTESVTVTVLASGEGGIQGQVA